LGLSAVRDARLLARAALARFGLPQSAGLTLARWGENAVFRVDLADRRLALRLHRPAYQSAAALASEHAWTAALSEAGVPLPRLLTTANGESAPMVAAEGVREKRRAALFEWLDGVALRSLRDADPVATLRDAGALMARLHLHASRWAPPAGFMRPAWDAEALVGDSPRWGPIEAAASWEPALLRRLHRARDLVRANLRDIGAAPAVYGLIHADLNPTNLMRHDDRLWVLDFDDCGSGWFAYDAATVLQDVALDDDFPALRDALLEGYRAYVGQPLPAGDRLDTFLMARRFARLGWVGSREMTPDVRAIRDRVVPTTADAVERFLSAAS
jgi:Ser/Thr protein kinase RdoA (MazF antagonist)